MRRGSRVEITNSERMTFQACRQLWSFMYRELLRPKRSARPLGVGGAVHAGCATMYQHIRAAQLASAEATGDFSVALSADELATVALGGVKKKVSDHLRALYELMEQSQGGTDLEELVEESRIVEKEVSSSVERFSRTFGCIDAERYMVLAVEMPFRQPLLDDRGKATPRAQDNGVMDLVVYDPAVMDFVLCEHKTSGLDARKAETKLDMDPQTSGYVWVLRQMVRAGWPHHSTRHRVPDSLKEKMPMPSVAGTGRVFYNVVRKSGPKQPEWNKDGTLSAAAVDTTRSAYEAALDVQESVGGPREDGKPQVPKLRTEKQVARLETLPANGDRWVKRHETWHSLSEQERWRSEVVVEAGQIRRAIKGTLPIIRSPGHCNMPWSMPCTMRGLCREDSPELRELGFKVVGDPHVEVVESEQEQGLEV